MDVLGAIITFILVLASMVGLFWSIVGLPVGIVLLILRANKKTKLSKKTILWITFGGLGLLVSSFVLFFIFSVILSFFGLSSGTLDLPPIE